MFRKIFLFIFILSLSTGITLAQDEEVSIKPDDVPKAVIKKLQILYPSQKEVNWSKVKSEFTAEFKINGHSSSVTFDNIGNWIETESETSATDLPEAVINVISKKYSGYTTDYVTKTVSPKTAFYEITFKKGKDKLYIIVNEQGRLIEKEE